MTLYCESGSKFGINKICSNLPINEWNTKQPDGTHYDTDIHFSIPISQIVEWSTILDMITIPALETEFQAAGYAAKISNLKLSTPTSYDLMISFDANSPWVYLVVIVILAILAVIGIYLIDQITVTISKSPALSVGAGAMGVAVAIGVVAVSLIALSQYIHKKKKG